MTDHGQLSRDDLKGMSSEAISQARTEGRLNAILGIDAPATGGKPAAQVSYAELATMSGEEVAAAKAEGRLDYVLGVEKKEPPRLTRDDLKRMHPNELLEAQREGRLDHLLGVDPAVSAASAKARDGQQLSIDDVRALRAAGREDDIVEAKASGQLADLIGEAS